MNAPKVTTTEPAVTTGLSIGALVGAVIGLLKAFGVEITAEQAAAILAVVAILGPPITSWLIRRQVWSPAGLAEVLPVHEGAGPADGDKAGDHRAGKPVED